MTEQPHPDRVRLLPWSVPPQVVDIALVTLVAAAAAGRVIFERDQEPNLYVEATALVVAIAAIVARRRFPVAALVVAVLAIIPTTAIAERPSIIMPAALVVLFHLATVRPWQDAVIAGASASAIFATLVITLLERGRIEGAALASVAWPAFAAAAGSSVRAVRYNLAAAQERARRAEESREIEATRRVSEERLRIARDVHDLVAHHLAVVNVQAGVAGHLLRTNPEAAEDALDTIRNSASTGVNELGQLLSVLRAPGEPDGPTDPTPDLDSLDDLISSFSASGLHVTHNTSGAPRPLSEAAQVAAYRVVQEALTNAHKHGDGSVVLDQSFTLAGLDIVVSNRVGPPHKSGDDNGTNPEEDIPSSGYGLVGMRERVESNGGKLSIENADGRFVVRAHLPALEST